MESKGYTDDEAIDIAEKEFGRNEMIMVRNNYKSLIVQYFLKTVLAISVFNKVGSNRLVCIIYMTVFIIVYKEIDNQIQTNKLRNLN